MSDFANSAPTSYSISLDLNSSVYQLVYEDLRNSNDENLQGIF